MRQPRHSQLTPPPALQGGYFVLTTDGAIEPKQGSKPRRASIGVVLRDPKGRLVSSISRPISKAQDPHEAEYTALIRGLQLARRHGIQRLHVFLDSALVVNQLSKEAEVKGPHLKPLQRKAKKLLGGTDTRVSWIPRGWNTEADLLAAMALESIRRRDKA